MLVCSVGYCLVTLAYCLMLQFAEANIWCLEKVAS